MKERHPVKMLADAMGWMETAEEEVREVAERHFPTAEEEEQALDAAGEKFAEAARDLHEARQAVEVRAARMH